MADLPRLFRRARDKARDLAQDAPPQARRAAEETRRTAGAVSEVLDERTGGRFGEVLERGGEVAGRVGRTPAEVRDAFRAGAAREGERSESYRPDPIEPPAPIDRPEPL
ncbi:antitoxin [Mobilicoccus pelagius]|uniref:Putative oxidoreductase n=1 Tax=Mobilicoccus pelagius NBRC 104925 TaxID=1089455 RepID=H5UU03_9MICO|nr:antitoxin [Mobilicoccus pelagius]GAB49211.1 putative oxidoreductase [Mobilicoccus pelagius NBRC 104925]